MRVPIAWAATAFSSVARGSSLDRQHLSQLSALYPGKPRGPIPQGDAGPTTQQKHIEELREHAVTMVFAMRDQVRKEPAATGPDPGRPHVPRSVLKRNSSERSVAHRPSA